MTAWCQTTSGRLVDLVNPSPAMIDFTVDVPEQLARQSRFAGATASGPYSIAQHCVHGADALKAETGRSDLAFLFLLHDAHEYVLGDMTQPVAQALSALLGPNAGVFRAAVFLLKARLDHCIHTAAGLVGRPVCSPAAQAEIKQMDRRMLRTERDHLLGTPPSAWPEIEHLEPVRFPFGALRPWPWPKAADEWRDRFQLYQPKEALP